MSDDVYRITVALAGFSKEDVEIVTENNRLSVRGAVKDKNGKNYRHHGIAQRSFQRVFDLAEHIVVAGASMENGLLVIELKREVPEASKPRTIPIGDKPAAVSLKAVDKSAERNAA